MKKALIYYGFFSVVLIIMIYFFTLIQISRSRNIDVFLALQEEAVETFNYDDFIAYQSIAFQRVYLEENDQFHVMAYQVIAQDASGYRNQFMWILTEKEGMEHADSLDDENDLTDLKLTVSGTTQVLFDSSIMEIYQSKPISYGIERDGYYYYVFFLETSNEIDIEHKGYDGQIIYQDTIDFVYEPFETSSSYTPGMTTEEKDELIDLETYLRPAMTRNITTFLIVDILCGGALYIFFNLRKKQ